MSTSVLDPSTQEQKIAERVNPDITKALVVSQGAGGVMFANAEQVTEFAKMMAVTQIGIRQHLRGKVGACLAIVVQAVEWGMSPYAVANKSYFVNDQIAFESQLIQAVILKRAPIIGRIKFEFEGEGDNRVCIASARLNDGSGDVVEYRSPKFSKILPKNSPLWKNDPDQQHCYYSGRALCRRHFPDVLLGVYDKDELLPNGTPIDGAPTFAKDVTPARSIAAKLDAFSPKSPESAQAEDEAEENEADEADHGELDEGEGHHQDADDDADDEAERTPRERLLIGLREQITGGATAMRAIGMLSEDQRELLTDQDRADLKTFWKSRQQPDGRARQPEQADA